MLDQLPGEFKLSDGGGWSFLNACVESNGTLWGQHADVEALMALGIATDLVKYNVPRELWSELPGGMPYFVFNDRLSVSKKRLLLAITWKSRYFQSRKPIIHKAYRHIHCSKRKAYNRYLERRPCSKFLFR